MNIYFKLQEEYDRLLALKGIPRERIPSDEELRIMLNKIIRNSIKDAENISDLYRDFYLELTETEINDIVEKSIPKHRNLMQNELDEYQQNITDVIKGLDNLSHINTDKFYVSTLPVNSINASVFKSESGYLVLMNSGLINFITQYTQILFSLFNNITLSNYEYIIGILTELALCYITNTNVSHIRARMPRTLGNSAVMQKEYSDACIMFIIAHEFGHAVLGHLDRNETEEVKTEYGDIEVLKQKSWQDEFDADIAGLKLLLIYSLKQEEKNPQDKRGEMELSIAGCMLFFCIDIFMTTIYYLVKPNTQDAVLNITHPPAKERIDNIINFINEIDISNKLQLAKSILGLSEIILSKSVEMVSAAM